MHIDNVSTVYILQLMIAGQGFRFINIWLLNSSSFHSRMLPPGLWWRLNEIFSEKCPEPGSQQVPEKESLSWSFPRHLLSHSSSATQSWVKHEGTFTPCNNQYAFQHVDGKPPTPCVSSLRTRGAWQAAPRCEAGSLSQTKGRRSSRKFWQGKLLWSDACGPLMPRQGLLPGSPEWCVCVDPDTFAYVS